MKAAVLVRVVRDQMARRPMMLCAALLVTCGVILTLTLTCSRAKSVVALARPPVRFLSPSVPVVDLFLGQQDQAETLMEGSDVTVLFYYAPWCAHSIAAREHIHQVALHLSSQVQFVAVNCWWHQGKCRKQQNFYQYPVLHVYYRRFGPVPYKGPFIAEYLESFIHRVSAPLTYLSSRSALHTFLSHHEQGVVGFFDFNASPQPPGYLTFFLSALHALRKDPQGAVRFSVVTNRDVAAGMWVTEDQSVYLHRRFNASLVFPRSERNFTPENICNWIYENKESLITWIQPIGEKSHALEAELRKGPALLMFLPQSPRSDTQTLSEVSDIALRYYSCLTGRIYSSVWSPSGSALIKPKCCKSLHMSTNTNTKVCEVCVRSAWDLGAALNSFLSGALSTASSFCSNTQRSYSLLSHYTSCCRTLTHSLRPLMEGDGVTGLHCRTNKTLRFYALDSRLAWPLAQRLGAAGNRSTHSHTQTFTTIVSLREETHYVLQGAGREALERFILNFSATYSPLHRHLVGVSEASPPHSLIQEVTTDSFRAIVMDAEKDVLLFYYTGWCGFCTVLNHVLLRLARLYQGNSSFTVARVNVGLNDLPWEFMVDHLPTFLFFPRHRKHMSVKFPETTRVTLPNLVRFILNHSSPTPQGKVGPKVLLEVELHTLQGEVLSLQRARERLSQQLAALWRENRRLALHTKELQSHNAELQEQSSRLETLYQEKSRQLTEAIKRLQELADASEDLLSENSLLKVLLAVLREKDSVGRTGGWSWAEDRGKETHGQGEGEENETEDGMQDVS